jgi:hypothetical protein
MLFPACVPALWPKAGRIAVSLLSLLAVLAALAAFAPPAFAQEASGEANLILPNLDQATLRRHGGHAAHGV